LLPTSFFERNLRGAIHVYLFVVLSISVSCNNPQNDPRQQQSSQPKTVILHDLKHDEALGGHTLQRHVGQSDEELLKRLRAQPEIAAASTYADEETADQVVSAALSQNSERVEAWRSRPARKPNLVLHYHGAEPIGRSVRQGESLAADCYDAIVVLKADGPGDFHVLTTYPELK